MAELPSGTVTFLFTDLEGSTRLWEEHPDAMQGALARHDVLLRAAIDAHDGHVVKTTGDGFHAVFASAARRAGLCDRGAVRVGRRALGVDGAAAGAHGCAHGRGRAARRRLLRSGAESGSADHERGSRRPGLVVAGDRGRSRATGCQQAARCSIWASSVSGIWAARSWCSRSCIRSCRVRFRCCGRSIRFRGTCPRS